MYQIVRAIFFFEEKWKKGEAAGENDSLFFDMSQIQGEKDQNIGFLETN